MVKENRHQLFLRQYQSGDREAILGLHYQALAEAGIHSQNTEHDRDLYNIHQEYLENQGEFLVATIDNQVIAMGGLCKVNSDTAKIVRMRVHPLWRRQGIGRALLQALEKKAQQQEYATLILDTLAVRAAAQQFYVKNGYTEIGREKIQGKEVVYFEKKISSW